MLRPISKQLPIRWCLVAEIRRGEFYGHLAIDRQKRKTNSFKTYEAAEEALRKIKSIVKAK